MSRAGSFSSFGLEENIPVDDEVKENIEHTETKSTSQSILNNKDILNYSYKEDDIFFTNKQTLPIMIKTKRMKRFAPEFDAMVGTDCQDTNHNQAQTITLHKWQNILESSNYRKTKTRTKTVNSRFLVKAKEMREFFKLTEDPVISEFLKMDSCKRIADKYLIAMVFAYFKRADFSIKDYNSTNFFTGLYLASDVEEDEEEIKHEIFPWALGKNWRETYVDFLRKRDELFKRIDYKAIISRKCCDEIMNIIPDSPLWKRERSLHHAGAIRGYAKDPRDDDMPRGPDASPLLCPECDTPDSQYGSASPDNLSWIISSGDSSNNSR